MMLQDSVPAYSKVVRRGYPRVSRVVAALTAAAVMAGGASVAYAGYVKVTSSWTPSKYQLYLEQVASQDMINDLISNQIGSLDLGKPKTTATMSTIPVTARYRSGARVLGTMIMRKYKGNWYFYSITRGPYGKGISDVPAVAGISSNIVNTAFSEQTAHKWIVMRIPQGRWTQLKVTKVRKNWGTATISIQLLKPKNPVGSGTITAIRKDASSGTPYWFLSSFK